MKFGQKIAAVAALTIASAGCFKDLNTVPKDPTVTTAATVYDDPNSYKKALAKLYAGFSVSGQEGPSGQPDIAGIDEGFGQYLRGYWYHQELPTDEAVIAWNDQTIKDFHAQSWTDKDGFIYAFYSRIFFQIALENEFLRETTDAKLDSRGVDAATKADVHRFRAEARFLRALSYWHALDLFRSTPFATEDDVVGASLPKQATPQELFNFIESECLAIDADLADARSNEYGRADKACAWMLLAKLYLNAEVYIGEKKYDKSLEQCEKVIGAGFTLEPNWQDNFLADNDRSKEVIFPVTFDGINTRTWGGTTFIIRAGIGGSMNPVASGVASGWGGTRTTRQFYEKFPAGLADGIIVKYNPGKAYSQMFVVTSDLGLDTLSTAIYLSSPLNNKVFEGHLYFPNDNTKLLFCPYPDITSTKYGDNGANGSLEKDGTPIVVASKGFYRLAVNTSGTTKTYTIEPETWSITGAATGGSDVNFTWDAASKTLFAHAQLQAGTYRFRANQDNARNLGDTGADALLEKDGADLVIDKAGGYDINLKLDRPDYTYQLKTTDYDRRGKFYTNGQNVDIADLTMFTDGVAINKFRNVTSTGAAGKNADFPDTDFPMFRLADAYLMASECLVRMGGDKQKAADYFNKVRERAYQGASGNITAADLSLDLLLDERGRELYWECQRRTDLVRFGQFTDGNYLWQWKGGTAAGEKVGNYRNIYPIPGADLGTNPNLKQNPGY